MKLARVIGNLWATRKDDRLESRRMLLVQPLNFSGKRRGDPIIALDTADAGVGDVVIYATASEAAIPFQPGLTPTDATIVGVVDRVDHVDWSYVARAAD
ncbi:MAG: EutN/CcmL family microcompartment protein [Acidiferrobacterales bacterium]|nr:EutN/CcmL family microcompartment protein [Acidiferrobacterales bacterium]